MKVVHVLNTGGYSGAENVVITIINHLKKKNIECVYLSPYGSIALSDLIKKVLNTMLWIIYV